MHAFIAAACLANLTKMRTWFGFGFAFGVGFGFRSGLGLGLA